MTHERDVTRMSNTGQYYIDRGYIALRDIESNQWRVSVLSTDINDHTKTTLTLVTSFQHLYEVEEFVEGI